MGTCASAHSEVKGRQGAYANDSKIDKEQTFSDKESKQVHSPAIHQDIVFSVAPRIGFSEFFSCGEDKVSKKTHFSYFFPFLML